MPGVAQRPGQIVYLAVEPHGDVLQRQIYPVGEFPPDRLHHRHRRIIPVLDRKDHLIPGIILPAGTAYILRQSLVEATERFEDSNGRPASRRFPVPAATSGQKSLYDHEADDLIDGSRDHRNQEECLEGRDVHNPSYRSEALQKAPPGLPSGCDPKSFPDQNARDTGPGRKDTSAVPGTITGGAPVPGTTQWRRGRPPGPAGSYSQVRAGPSQWKNTSSYGPAARP